MNGLRRQIQLDLERPFLDGYRLFAGVLAAYFTCMAPIYFLDASNPAGRRMVPVTLAVAGLLGFARILLRPGRLDAEKAPRVAVLIMAAVLGQIFIHMGLSQRLLLSSDFMLVLTATGLAFPRRHYYFPFLFGTLAAWGISVAAIPVRPMLDHWCLGILSATLVSVAIHLILQRLLRSQEALRFQDLTREQEKARLVDELADALDKVKTLSGLIPICSYCKKVRDDEGFWSQVEHYLQERSDATFTHGVCPDCDRKVRDEARREGLLP